MKTADISVELVDYMGSDLSVVNAARVSFAKQSSREYVYTPVGDGTNAINAVATLKVADQKLIKYLASHGHWSPFAHAFMTFRIKAPIFVARQLVKHQVGLSWNEESRRYIDEEPEFYMPSVWRARPEGSVKQGSGGDVKDQKSCHRYVNNIVQDSLEYYNILLQEGVAPEQARMVLPLCTHSNWIWSGSLMAFARVCKQRLDPHSQKECQDVAVLMNALAKETFPYSWEALVDNKT